MGDEGTWWINHANVAHHAVAWWEGAAGALLGAIVGALIGSCVPLLWSWRLRRAERRGEITAMQAEMYQARIAMRALGDSSDEMPATHLPLAMFRRALPKLIGEHRLTGGETAGLIEYVTVAEELNVTIDRVSNAAAANLTPAANEAHSHCIKIANYIRSNKQERLRGYTIFELAEAALYRLDIGGKPSNGI